MWQTIAKTLFGSSNDRYVKSLDKIVSRINARHHFLTLDEFIQDIGV